MLDFGISGRKALICASSRAAREVLAHHGRCALLERRG